MDQPSDLPTRKPLITLSPRHLVTWLGAILVFLTAFSLYIATLAPGPVPGDPSEYIFVPYILGIAHPPGYAFYTLVAKLWQTVIRAGTIAYRTNLFAAFAGASVVTLVYGIVWQIAYVRRSESSRSGSPWAGTSPAPTSPTLGAIVGAFKSITTNEYIRSVHDLGWPPFDKRIWQRNYYEHIIRSQTEFDNIWNYIECNPQNWDKDRFIGRRS